MREQHWSNHEPKAIVDGQVTVQAHDFFTPQPIGDADIFLLRHIIHDWPDAKVIEILKRLREVSVPGKTRVVVIDCVVQYACATDQKKIRGAENITFEGLNKKREVPAGLLPNLGRAESVDYYLDLVCAFPPHHLGTHASFLTRLQYAGVVQWERAHAGKLYPGDGGKWVENPEDILSDWG